MPRDALRTELNTMFDDYLEQNKDFSDFLDHVSNNTGTRNHDAWIKNLRENRELFRKSDGWATSNLQDVEEGKTAIMMGASPAIKNQVDQLKEIQDDENFVLCGMSSNLEFLLKNGIHPKYCITVDADISTGKDWDNVDMAQTKDIILITNTFSYPPMLKKWQGRVLFLAVSMADKAMRKKQNKWYGHINGLGAEFPALMGQFNIMTAFAFLCLGCHIILFVGNELSYQDEKAKYYVDRPDPRDSDKKWPHGDIYGNMIYTTSMLLALKLALESFLGRIAGAGWFINCSEAGIFGVTKRFPDRRVPWIHQLTLKDGIMQARNIMKTGEPVCKPKYNSKIWVPDINHNINLKHLSFA
jgi:hypothetical protein